MRLGIGSYAVPWSVGIGDQIPEKPITPEELLELGGKLGVGAVQFCDNLPIDPWVASDPARLDALVHLAKRLDIQLEIGTRGLDAEALGHCAEIANLAGSPFVRVVVDGPGYKPSVEQLISDLGKLRATFEKRGLKLAIENHDRFHTTQLLRVIERAGRDWLGICFDTANSLGRLQGPDEALDDLLPFVLNLHIKDVRADREGHMLGFRISGTPAGEGAVDSLAVMRAVKKVNPEANAIIELWTPFQADLQSTIALENEWLEKSVSNLRSWV